MQATEETVQFETCENATVCFVNTMDTPHDVVRLPHFRYSDSLKRLNSLDFFQLCEYTYQLRKQDVACNYKVLIWEAYSVPHYKQSLFKLVIDSTKALMQ